MADEISLSLTCDITSDNFKAFFRPGTISPDLASSTGDAGVRTCNTSFSQLNSAGVAATAGYMFFRNLSTGATQTNDVIDIAHTSATSQAFCRLGPGEVACFRGGTAMAITNIQIRVQNTAAASTGALQYLILSP
jgi:hypothetical protein